MTEPILATDDLAKHYGGVYAVNRLCFAVFPGEIYGLLGPNGAGKSTALHCLTGLLHPSAGTMTIASLDARSMEAKRHLGFVPDALSLPGTLTGREYLAFMQAIHGIAVPDLVDALAAAMSLTEALDRLIREYSHGMHKKLQVMGAVLHDPSCLVLDEPFGGLDPEAMMIIRHLLRARRERGEAALVATHDLSIAAELCDRVGIVADGELVAEGSLIDLEHIYGGDGLEEIYFEASGLGERSEQVDAFLARAFPRQDGSTTSWEGTSP